MRTSLSGGISDFGMSCISAAGGGIAGTLGALSGAEARAALDAVAGQMGFVAGSQVGEAVDANVLVNCECLDSWFVFNAPATKKNRQKWLLSLFTAFPCPTTSLPRCNQYFRLSLYVLLVSSTQLVCGVAHQRC